jgi:peptidoglycan/LPS O-acetylase OafA/YrhL
MQLSAQGVQPSAESPGKSRIEFLDALRGLAILLVIVNHAAGFSGARGVAGYAGAMGAYGVQLFFVISAYTIFLTLSRAAAKEARPLRNFFIRRVLRIVPLYWFGIALYAAVYGSGSRGWLPGPQPWHYPMHLLLMNVLHPEVQSSVVPGGWSISCEVIFYLSVPLWFATVTTLRRACWFLVLTVVLGPLAVHGLAQLFAASFADVPAATVSLYWYRSPLNQLGCFAFGILLFFLVKEGAQRWVQTPLRNAALYVAAPLIALIGVRAPNSQHFMAAAFLLLAFALAAKPSRWIVNRPMIFIGRISYSAYVVHFLVIAVVATWISAQWGAWRFPLLAMSAVILVVPIATLCHHAIELPFIRLGKQLIEFLDRPATAELPASEPPR